jgi:ornithine decarboxylase
LLRIRADDPAARCQLGNKYGAEHDDVPRLLRAARALGLAVRGVSFHVGSGARNPDAFVAAIAAARSAFDVAIELGFDPDMLDIGGGFPGGVPIVTLAGPRADFLGAVPEAINAALDDFFPEDGRLRVIAEPGRYFAEGSATYACCVNGWRARHDAGDAEGQAAGVERQEGEEVLPAMDYYLSDGLYGSMNW